MNARGITIQNRSLHLRTGGSGPGLLLLHSAWGDAELSWSRVWDELSGSFTVVAPDMPGFGRSAPQTPISPAESVRLLAGLLDHLKIDTVIIAGNSFGVALATEFALAFPDRTAHLVVVNGGYLPSLPAFLKKFIRIPAVEKRVRTFMRSMVYSDRAFNSAFPNKQLLPPEFFACIREHEEQHSRAVFDAFMLQTAAQRPPKVPTTLIWGTGDRLLSRNQTRRVQTWFRDPAVISLNGAGHMPQVEQPREFVEAMKAVREKGEGVRNKVLR